MAKRINQKGFTLLEVLFALAIFGVFLVGISDTISYNVSSSIRIREDINLSNLAELKMNQVMLDRKDFTNATENDVDSGNFEIEGMEKYKYEVRIRKTEFPDLSEILGQDNEEDNNQRGIDPVTKIIFTKLKNNLEEMIWQVNVKIINTETNYSYELNSWINKSNPRLDTNFTF